MRCKLIMQAYLIPVNQVRFSIGVAEAIFHMPDLSVWIYHTSLQNDFPFEVYRISCPWHSAH